MTAAGGTEVKKLGDGLMAVFSSALDAVSCPGMQVWEIVGHGKQAGITEQFRGREFKVDLLPKTKIEIVVNDSQVKNIVETIVRTASTNSVGDGKNGCLRDRGRAVGDALVAAPVAGRPPCGAGGSSQRF